jgi:signal transduction histidine kinase
VREAAEGVNRALSRLYSERNLQFDVNVSDHVRVERADLDEMLGNLLDNAAKWARSRVSLTSSRQGATVVIDIEDDGGGIVPEMRAAVLQRGVRADEAAPGSGLGLAIVRDLAELYGGTIALDESPRGGLRARLRLPAVGAS